MKKKLSAPKANEKIQRLFNISVKSVNEETRTVDFVFSDDSVDRYGEVVEQDWDTANYEKNPVILWGHDPSKAENVIGSGSNLRINQAGKSIVSAQFDDDPHSDLIFRKIVKGILRTVSAGFIPHKIEFDPDGNEPPRLKENELLEISVVAIPANPNAVALDLREGSMKVKDAQFLMKSMREEADRIEAELARKKDASGTEVDNAEIAALQADVTEIKSGMTTLSEGLATLTDAVTVLVEKSNSETSSAKGGDNDQPGADDEIDPEAELNEEELAELLDTDVPDDEAE